MLKLIERLREMMRKKYNPQDIQDCIKMYFDIVADMTSCTCKGEIKSYFIDIEIFEKRFRNKVPQDLFYTYLNRLEQLWAQETKRVEAGKKPLYLR